MSAARLVDKAVCHRLTSLLCDWGRIGPGGPPGLQTRLSRGDPTVGVFDSHTLPPLIKLPVAPLFLKNGMVQITAFKAVSDYILWLNPEIFIISAFQMYYGLGAGI